VRDEEAPPVEPEGDGGAAQGRSWGAIVGLALVVAASSVVHPALLIFVPLSLLLLALPPRRPVLVVVAAVMMGIALAGPPADAFWYAERGWALVLGGWFLIMVVALPAAGFFSRALAAVGATLGSAALLLLATRGGWQQFDSLVAQRLRAGASDMLALWSRGGASEWGRQFGQAMQRAAEIQALLFPALLGLGSLAALAVAWWGYRRLGLAEPRPLRPVREFRFPDELVWLLIAGIALVLLPLDAVGERAGANLLVFMAALYALRGAGVLLARSGRLGPGAVIAATLAILFLYPLVVAATVLVGLADTWLDLRARRPVAGPQP
jgi:hypothetical protein